MPSSAPIRAYELLDLLYGCITRPAEWSRFTEELARALGNAAVSILLGRGWETRGDRLFTTAPNPLAYREVQHLDPWAAAYRSAPVGKVALICEPPAAEVEGSEFHRLYLEPQGLGLGPPTVILLEERKGQLEGIVSVHPRAQGPPLGPQHLELLNTLAPHLVRARQLCLLFDRGRATQGGLIEALNRLQMAVLLLDSEGRAVFGNRSALELFGVDRSQPSARRIEQLREAQRRLLGTVRILTDGAGLDSLVLPHPGDGAPLPVITSQLTGRPVTMGHDVRTVVFIGDPRRLSGSPLELLRSLYGLTRSEAKLTVLLTLGRTMDEAAEQLGITPGTARTRLKKIFVKTGVKRQGDLIRMVMSGPGLLREELRPEPPPVRSRRRVGATQRQRARRGRHLPN